MGVSCRDLTVEYSRSGSAVRPIEALRACLNTFGGRVWAPAGEDFWVT
jgi:hypothetical protein